MREEMGQESVWKTQSHSHNCGRISPSQCCASISFIRIYLLDMDKVYYLFYLIFSKSIYPNQMCIQGYINLKKYIHFTTLNISQKYPYLKSNMFSNLGKFLQGKSHLNLKLVT